MTSMQLLGQPKTFFTLLDINAADVDLHATAIGQLRDGFVTGIIDRIVLLPARRRIRTT